MNENTPSRAQSIKWNLHSIKSLHYTALHGKIIILRFQFTGQYGIDRNRYKVFVPEKQRDYDAKF